MHSCIVYISWPIEEKGENYCRLGQELVLRVRLPFRYLRPGLLVEPVEPGHLPLQRARAPALALAPVRAPSSFAPYL